MILSSYFTTQTLTQFASIAAGLLFVNFMAVPEFALYTLALSIVSFFAFASDLGSTASLLYFFRSLPSGHSGEFARYKTAVLSLRRQAFALGALVLVVFFPYVALQHGYRMGGAILANAGILLCVWFQILASLRLLSLRLYEHYGRSYRAELQGNALRLTLAVLLVATGWVPAWAALIANAAAAGLTARRAILREPRHCRTFSLGPYRREVVRYLLPTLPGALYFSIQGPLTVWLSATFGSVRQIAEVGALGRLGLIVGLLSGLTGTIFLPRLARITDERVYRRRYMQYGAALAIFAGLLVAAAAAAPTPFLFLLGGQYAHLHREVLLVVAAAALTLLDGYALSVNCARAWTRWQTVAVGGLFIAQTTLALTLPLSTAAGVLTFNLLSAGIALGTQVTIAWAGFFNPRWVRWNTK